MFRAACADDQCRRFAQGKCLGADEDPVVGRPLLREIDDRSAVRACARNRHGLRGRIGLAGASFCTVGTIVTSATATNIKMIATTTTSSVMEKPR